MRLIKKIFACLVFIGASHTINAQCPVDEPVLYCTDASVPGETKVTFSTVIGTPYQVGPPEQGGFTYFELQHALAPGGPWDSVAASNMIGTTELTHMGAVHNVINYYRVITHSLCDNTTPGVFEPVERIADPIISTIILNTTVTDDTLFTIAWNNNSQPNPNATDDYFLRAKVPLSTTTTFTTRRNGIPFGTQTYQDTLKECNDQVVYQIDIGGPAGSGCRTISAPDTSDVIDNTPPSFQYVDSVSFNHFLGKPVIGWSANDQNDIAEYVVVECFPGGWTPIDTLPNSARSFIDTNYIDGSKIYSVYAVDICGNASTAFLTDCHNSIFLTTEIDVCEETVELLWNAYDDYRSGIDVVYQVYVSQGGAPPTLLGTTTETRYLHEDPITNTSLTYYVRAVENNGAGPFTTISNAVNLATEFLRAPSFSYLRKVSVEDRNDVRMEMYVDVAGDIKEYRIKRSSDSLLSNFITIGTLRLPDTRVPADSIVGFRDLTATTDISSYYYLIESLDSCGRILDTSNFASSMNLKVTVNNAARTNTLNWNNYVGWEGDVFGYRVYRAQDGVWENQPVVTVFPALGGESSYIDDVNGLTENAEGNFCYYVEAIEDEPTFPRLNPSTAKSNIACVNQQPLVFIPNAFTPEGMNPIFKPVFVFTDFDNYQLTIFNRYGEIVFETNSLDAGWDGSIDGTPMPTGAYTYLIKYRAITGQKFQQRGMLTLMR